MKVYIVTYYNHYESWGAIESVYTSKKKAEKTVEELRRTSDPGGVAEYEIEEFEISKDIQIVSKFNCNIIESRNKRGY